MRQSIRALGWTITIVTLLISAFLVSSVYSLMQMMAVDQGIRFIDFRYEVSNGTFVLSLVLSVNNTSYFDISELNVISVLRDFKEATISEATTSFGKIASGSEATGRHNLTISIEDILDENLTYLLFQDGDLNIDTSVGLGYANVLGFQITMSNMSTLSWGAPLHGFTLERPQASFNGTHLLIDIFLEVENHSFFDMIGNLHLKVYNETGGYIGSGRGAINIPHGSRLSGPIEVAIEIDNPSYYTGKGNLEVYFEPSIFDYRLELARLSYG